MQKILQEIPSTVGSLLPCDFSMNPDKNCIRHMCQKFSIHQWITEQTHYTGRTVDLIFTSFCTDAETAFFPYHA